MRTRIGDVVQGAAELYVEAQAVERRRGDARFTAAQRRAALAEMSRLALGVAALLQRIDAEKGDAPRG